MVQGGARNRAGRRPGENSELLYSLTALPAEGFAGPVPAWPLPSGTERELELWAWAWRTPQACAWSLPSEAWRIQTVARWVRQAVLCESPEGRAADHAQLHRYADQIGLTTAGLREMGWKVAPGQVPDKAGPVAAPTVRRLRAVGDDQ